MKGSVYFVLYLAVVLEILVVILDRDDAEDELRREISVLVPLVVTPPATERQVLRLYVDADDNTGAVLSHDSLSGFLEIAGLKGDTGTLSSVVPTKKEFYETRELLSDVRIDSLARRVTFDSVSLGEKPQFDFYYEGKSRMGQIIKVPFSFHSAGSSVGLYRVTFDIHSSQVHFLPEGGKHPREVQFGQAILPFGDAAEIARTDDPDSIRAEFDHAKGEIYVAVIDTTVSVGKSLAVIFDAPDRWIMGTEVRVPYLIKGLEHRQVPNLSVDLGRLETETDSTGVWSATFPEENKDFEKTVTLFAQLNQRSGNKKDIIKVVHPTLLDRKGMPNQICRGDPVTINIQVAGLDNTEHYQLKYAIDKSKDSTLRGARCTLAELGRGDSVRFSGFYDSREFKYFDEKEKRLKPMVWSATIVDPPIQISENWGASVGLSGELCFSAYRGCTPQHKKPLGSNVKPQITIVDDETKDDVTGIFLKDVRSVETYDYCISFRPDATFRDPDKGDWVKIKISIPETSYFTAERVRIKP
jgi:hypothetical protein